MPAVCNCYLSSSSLHIPHTADTVPKVNLMGMDTPLFTPRSSDIDTSSLPFVFSDGVLSFYSPSTDSTNTRSALRTSPPASSVSNASFLGVLPDGPRSGKSSTCPILQKLVIWRHSAQGKDHVYADTGCISSPSIRETTLLEDMDPSSVRYGAVYASLSQISAMPCPVTQRFITLTPFSPTIADDPHTINSVITISTPARSPVRLMCAIYSQGALAFSTETTMTEEAPSHFGDPRYSAALPQQLVDELCKDVDGLNLTEEGMLGSIAVLQFMQDTEAPESRDENVIFVLVCEFEAGQESRPSQRSSYPPPGTIQFHDSTMYMESLPTPPTSHEDVSDVKHFALESVQSPKRRASSRTLPRLSVAIPPPCHPKNRIQIYNDSPGPTHTHDVPFPLIPQSGVPQNVFPATPIDQLIATPPHPLEMRHRVCNSHAPIPESAYPFTLTSASPSSAQSPAFGLLDSSDLEESEPPRTHLSQSCTSPLSSPFLQSPYAASPSNVMSSVTRDANKAGVPTFSSSHIETSLDQPLASPHPIASAPHLQ